MRESWFEKHPRSSRLGLALIVFLLLEVLVRALVAVDLLPYQRYQTGKFPEFIDYIDRDIGLWRYSDSQVDMFESCMSVSYESNKYGAFDRERAAFGSDRVVVLGDSFAAGDWMHFEKRFPQLLELRTGRAHLNFAVGGTGTVHQWQVYQHKVQPFFEHEYVFLFVFPFNDFENNRPGSAYIPTLKRASDSEGYELYFPIAFEDRPRDEKTLGTRIKNTIDNTLYIANILRWAAREFKDWRRGNKVVSSSSASTSHYDSFVDDDFDVFITAVDGIRTLAEDRQFFVFTIPYFKDFDYARENGYDFELVNRLNEYAAPFENVHIVDILPEFLDHAASNNLSYSDYTLGCDLHWNELGHKVAADAVFNGVSEIVYLDKEAD